MGKKRKGCGAHHQGSQEHSRAALRFARIPQKIASQNALRHGLLARTVVLEEESEERFRASLEALISELERRPIASTKRT